MGKAALTARLGMLAWLAPLSIPILIGYFARSEFDREVSAWRVKGPPCPTTDQQVEGTPRHPARTSAYGGLEFRRIAGHMYCADVPTGGLLSERTELVCQFSAPALLAVSRGGETVAYSPGVGRTTTVRFDGVHVRCVVGGWFKG